MSVAAVESPRVGGGPGRQRRRAGGQAAGMLLLLAGLGAGAWYGPHWYQRLTAPAPLRIPTARVRSGDVNLDVHATGSLKGGRADMLTAPAVAGGALSIKFLRDSGELVQPGDEVVAFDTSTQEYNLTQAQEALDQANQQVTQAQANADAQAEDDSYQLAKAQWDVERAQLQVKKNPISATVDAEKNDLTLTAAQEHLRQLKADVANHAANNAATVALQRAAVTKAEADATTAKNNIAAMTLTAKHAGYVALQQNTNTNMFFTGMQLPAFQIGDTARPGLAVAEIPDDSSWEVDIQVSELDAGHLSQGQPVAVEFIALPGQTFHGELQAVGAASGPAWNRQVACVVHLPTGGAQLRAGLSARVVITTETEPKVLWAPSQAVFDEGGHSYVYRQAAGQFARQEVTILRRSESQVVLTGLRAGDVIALTDPTQAASARAKAGGNPTTPGAPGGRGL